MKSVKEEVWEKYKERLITGILRDAKRKIRNEEERLCYSNGIRDRFSFATSNYVLAKAEKMYEAIGDEIQDIIDGKETRLGSDKSEERRLFVDAIDQAISDRLEKGESEK